MVAILACSDGGRPPKDLLTKDEMVKALSEVYLAEQRLSSLGLKRDSLKQIFSAMQDKVFASAGTTDSTLKHSLDYYQRNPQDMDDIYTALIDTLNLHEQRLISNQVKK
jgi:hypothetical protein